MTGNNTEKQGQSILLLSPFFYPEIISTGKYNTTLANVLKEYGHDVSVITFHPLYPDWRPKITDAKLDGIEIIRGGGSLPYPGSIIFRRIQLELLFLAHTVKNIFQRKPLDIVIPIFPPSLFYFIISKLMPRSVYQVGIVHDLLGVMANVSSSRFKKIMLGIIRFFEGKSLRSCDHLIFVSNSMSLRAASDYGLEKDRMSVAYPFVNLNKDILTDKLADMFQENKKHVVYSGALGEKQNPDGLIEFFKHVTESREDIICHIFSGGPIFERFKTEYKRYKKIQFHDLVPESNLYELYIRSDIQIIPQKSGTSDGAIPSKLPNIICAGTPVFFIGDPGSDLWDLVQESQIGYCSDSWDVSELADKLNIFLDEVFLSDNYARSKKVSDFIMKNFNIDNLVYTILQIKK